MLYKVENNDLHVCVCGLIDVYLIEEYYSVCTQSGRFVVKCESLFCIKYLGFLAFHTYQCVHINPVINPPHTTHTHQHTHQHTHMITYTSLSYG